LGLVVGDKIGIRSGAAGSKFIGRRDILDNVTPIVFDLVALAVDDEHETAVEGEFSRPFERPVQSGLNRLKDSILKLATRYDRRMVRSINGDFHGVVNVVSANTLDVGEIAETDIGTVLNLFRH
jgi:hypothetical protein